MLHFVPFAVPFGGDESLLVWELSSRPTAEALQRSLFTVFSRFGLLYLVRVFPNATVASSGFFAIIKFYSARDAHRAQKACNQKQLFQTSPVKVRLGTRHKAVQHNTLALNSSRCQELANYYFGFHGWSKRIIKLRDLYNLEERENEDIVTPLEKQSLKFCCALEVVFTSHECRSPGVGMAEEPLDKLEEESGKTAVAYRPCEEVTDARTKEELQDFIQVSYFSCQPCGQREEECLSDFSFQEEVFRLPELD
ncbi:RAD52 motif-containing protein 1-like isoform X2 [Delphinapterus leucas]|uniref:RAD52 motif-containing protein 1 n=1 Tax=Delphinapterus leucas TaxID=9749 RepID=A0A2Y9MJL0_DELLE|nr:RAD52 motif-containing protein 1-like isoform X2 [Delphinapterus leucas]